MKRRLTCFAAMLTLACHVQGQAGSAQQSPPPPAWETAAGGRQQFDTISIHPDRNPSDESTVNVSYGNDDTYDNTGGIFRATNWRVVSLISFAYKGRTGQKQRFWASLPDWALRQGFNIEARSDNRNATKDQMRLMVRSMLEERFGLKAHFESREIPVYSVEQVKPGTLGPLLRPHPADDSCNGASAAVTGGPPAGQAVPAPGDATHGLLPGGFPVRCGTFVNMRPAPPFIRQEGGRNLTMEQIVGTFEEMGSLDRPVVDHTGLAGRYDWVMKFIDPRGGRTPPPDVDGPTFTQALAQQDGLKLVPEKAAYDLFVLDHLEPPGDN